MNKIIIPTILSLVCLQSKAEVTGNFETTATIENSCLLSTKNVEFGVVNSPLTPQSTNGEMNIFCTNNSSYKIELTYANLGVYSNYTFVKDTVKPQGNGPEYHVFDSNGNEIGMMGCGRTGTSYAGKVLYQNQTVADLYGGTFTSWNVSGWHKDTVGACTSMVPNTPSAAGYGLMNGILRGDKLAYYIAIPGDNNKIWNQNNYYSSKGIGEQQSIPFNAFIVPNSSSSKYIAQDTYIDTVTAIISY